MRVLCLITDAYGGYGGIAVFNRDVISSLCLQSDIEEVVAIPRGIPNPFEQMPDNLKYIEGAAAGVLPYLISVLRNMFSRPRYKVVYCAHINLVPIAWLIGLILRVPVVLAIYGIDAWQPTGRSLTNYLVKRVSLIFSISNYTKDRFLEWSGFDPDRIRLLPNAIHLENYGEAEKPDYLSERYGLKGRKVLLTFGRIVSKGRAKGFDEVLDILPDLLKVVPSIVYLIAGDGEYRQALEMKASRLGISDHVVFTGMVAEEEKADLYRSSDVYVMPSHGEGFGFVFLEAMACGIPSIASTMDGSRDAVRNGQIGAIVDPNDPAALKDAILEALGKPRLVPEGLNYFAFPEFRKRLKKIVDEAISQGRSLA